MNSNLNKSIHIKPITSGNKIKALDFDFAIHYNGEFTCPNPAKGCLSVFLPISKSIT